MKTRTPGLLGANWQGGRGAGTASRTAEAPRGSSWGGRGRGGAGITPTACLATSSAHIPERNILSRQDSRVTPPDSVSEAFVLHEFHQNPNPLPQFKG